MNKFVFFIITNIIMIKHQEVSQAVIINLVLLVLFIFLLEKEIFSEFTSFTCEKATFN